MNLSKIAATAGIAGALSFAALGLGPGLAHADNDTSPPGPGWNGQGPGDPDNAQYSAIPLAPPEGPPPPPPSWAPGGPVVWDWGAHQWGIYWNNTFLPLQRGHTG